MIVKFISGDAVAPCPELLFSAAFKFPKIGGYGFENVLQDILRKTRCSRREDEDSQLRFKDAKNVLGKTKTFAKGNNNTIRFDEFQELVHWGDAHTRLAGQMSLARSRSCSCRSLTASGDQLDKINNALVMARRDPAYAFIFFVAKSAFFIDSFKRRSNNVRFPSKRTCWSWEGQRSCGAGV